MSLCVSIHYRTPDHQKSSQILISDHEQPHWQGMPHPIGYASARRNCLWSTEGVEEEF
jgi:hypothetical protein